MEPSTKTRLVNHLHSALKLALLIDERTGEADLEYVQHDLEVCQGIIEREIALLYDPEPSVKVNGDLG